MTELHGRVLVVDDDIAMCQTLVKGLSRLGFATEAVNDGAQAIERLRADDLDVLVTDLNMRGMSGLELCEQALSVRPGLPVILITAFGNLEAAVGAIRAGAYDFVTKPFDLDVLALALGRAVEVHRLRTDIKRLQAQADQATKYDGIVGESPAMQRLFDLLDRLRGSDIDVLVTGETGTGKELVGRALHRIGPRAHGPFVAVNCAALPEALLESELFGHARGAFTDARSVRTGLLLEAHGGTLLLDEVGELPLSMQPKLLRALQERVVRPVGSDREQPIDVRIVAATNRDLQEAVDAGRFRQDLYFRLNVVELAVPPLRARGNDVLLLAQRFLQRAAERAGRPIDGIDPDAAAKMLAYTWPGNVRELQNTVERAVALARFDKIVVDDLPERVREFRAPKRAVTPADAESLKPLEEVEREHILRVLDALGGHRSEAARVLGVDRKTLYRKLDRWQK